jgi:hypothetical protein
MRVYLSSLPSHARDLPVTGIYYAGPQMMATVWTLTAITIIVVAARIYTQAFLTRQFGLGDALILSSEVSRHLVKQIKVTDSH